MITYQIEEMGAQDLERDEFLDLLQIASVLNKHAAMAALYECPVDTNPAIMETVQQQETERGYCRVKFPV